MKRNFLKFLPLTASAFLPFSAALMAAPIPLADQPVFTTVAVPGNLALAISVEFPTVVSTAHPTIPVPAGNIDTNYAATTEYLGYFDPGKCYEYVSFTTETATNLRHFRPTGKTTSPTNRTCDGTKWSGNFLNWVGMSTIDAFRWALTGGYRRVDSEGLSGVPGVTLLEKSWSSNETDATANRHPFRRLTSPSVIAGATPLGGSRITFRVHALGNKLWFRRTDGGLDGSSSTVQTEYTTGTTISGSSTTVYEVTARVKVCDAAIPGLLTTGLETNCVAYSDATYKPEGLLQKYADRIRYSAFGYLRDHSITRDGGVLRARQAFIGPVQPVPGAPNVINPLPEWNGTTGVMYTNPLVADGTTTISTFNPTSSKPIINSGILNYLNKFGQINPTLNYGYKRFDPVGELYYAATRYLKGLPNVPSWTNMSGTASQKDDYLDGFPVINNWDVDPILYSCQKNFILGIGDVNTHADKNVPNKTALSGTANEPAYPSFTGDPVPSGTRTNQVGNMQGLGNIGDLTGIPWCCNNNSYFMAGIAYDSNTKDIRPDDNSVGKEHTLGKQTIQTYWLDVLEFSNYQPNNQFYLAAKYGGFKVPNGFDPDTNGSTPLPLTSWYTTGRLAPGSGQQLPDNYFTAARADQMVSGLTSAFTSIASAIVANTTASATATPQISAVSDANYSTSFNSSDWTSEVEAFSLDLTTIPSTQVSRWKFSNKLATQLSGTGWNTNRLMATWNGSKGVPFRYPANPATPTADELTTAQVSALDTLWRPGSVSGTDDSQDYLNYLRGKRDHETSSPNYRVRNSLVGDIVGSKLKIVGPPNALLEDEPGYTVFRDTLNYIAASGSTPAQPGRRTVVYVGSNAGVLHAINGALYTSSPGTLPVGSAVPEVDADAGKEMFAYVPSALFRAGSTPTDQADRGLAALGNPSYLHRYFVNATPKQFDIDLANTVAGKAGTASSPTNLSCHKPKAGGGYEAQNWRTVLIGGLGKGGKSYYALDVTDPKAITTEAQLASKVMWEFPRPSDPKDANLSNKVGYSYGEPVVVRTKQYGWTVIFSSGYNNNDGNSYFFLVDPCTGYLLQAPVTTKTGIATEGMAHPTAYVLNSGSGLADAAYSGDLLGNVWRMDMTATSGDFPTAERIAVLTDTANNLQPVTSRPLIEYDPATLKRFVLVGTGRLLDKTDTSALQQSFYAFKDGDVFSFDPTLNSASKLVKSDFVDLTNSLTTSTASFSPSMKGWYIDFGAGSGVGGAGWRMVDNGTALPHTGYLAFVTLLPNGNLNDPCLASGAISRIYGLNFGSGNPIFKDSSNNPIPYIEKNYRILDLRFISDGTGAPKLSFGSDAVGALPEVITTVPLPPPAWRILNSREIPIAE